jgi:hypothetical protein
MRSAVRRRDVGSTDPLTVAAPRHRMPGWSEGVATSRVAVRRAPGVVLASVPVSTAEPPEPNGNDPVTPSAGVWVRVAVMLEALGMVPSMVKVNDPVQAPVSANVGSGASGVGLDCDEPPQATRARTGRSARAFMGVLDGSGWPNVSDEGSTTERVTGSW